MIRGIFVVFDLWGTGGAGEGPPSSARAPIVQKLVSLADRATELRRLTHHTVGYIFLCRAGFVWATLAIGHAAPGAPVLVCAAPQHPWAGLELPRSWPAPAFFLGGKAAGMCACVCLRYMSSRCNECTQWSRGRRGGAESPLASLSRVEHACWRLGRKKLHARSSSCVCVWPVGD